MLPLSRKSTHGFHMYYSILPPLRHTKNRDPEQIGNRASYFLSVRHDGRFRRLLAHAACNRTCFYPNCRYDRKHYFWNSAPLRWHRWQTPGSTSAPIRPQRSGEQQPTRRRWGQGEGLGTCRATPGSALGELSGQSPAPAVFHRLFIGAVHKSIISNRR